MHCYERSLTLPVPRRELFEWHRRPGAFERLAPTWERLEIVERRGSIEEGDLLHFRIHKGPLRLDWVARHRDFEAGRQFVDVAERSPFAAWRHRHLFEDAPGGATLHDRVALRLPLHALSWPLLGRRVEAELERMFRQRHLRTAVDLRRHTTVAGSGAARKLHLCGESGLFAGRLAAFWTTGGGKLGRGRGAALVHVAPGLLAADPQPRGAPTTRFVDRLAADPPAVLVDVGPLVGARERSLAFETLRRAGVRVVSLRAGVVVFAHHELMSRRGAPLERAVAARGFIDLEDLVGLVHRVIHTPELAGPLDAVASERLVERLPGVLDFDTLARSLDHQLGRVDEAMLERALAAFEAQAQIGVSA